MIANPLPANLTIGRAYLIHYQIPTDRTNSGIAQGSFVDVFRGMQTLNGHEFLTFNQQAKLDRRFLIGAELVG